MTIIVLSVAEAPRFPQLGSLFFSTVTQRGLTIVTSLLQEACEQQIISDLDFDVVTHMWLGGLVTYVLTSFVLAGGKRTLRLRKTPKICYPLAQKSDNQR